MHYARILLKLSGEALGSDKATAFNKERLAHYTHEILQAYRKGVEIAIVIGGGNLWRGKEAASLGIGPTEAHYMGMLATMMNGLALRDALQGQKVPVTLMSSLAMPTLCPSYNPGQAISALSQKRIVIIGGGLGTPYFSTDTAAVSCALSLQVNLLLKATKVDGVYAQDPALNPKAKRYRQLPLKDVYTKNLQVMDMTAVTLARMYKLPITVYNACKKGYLTRLLAGERLGTQLVMDDDAKISFA